MLDSIDAVVLTARASTTKRLMQGVSIGATFAHKSKKPLTIISRVARQRFCAKNGVAREKVPGLTSKTETETKQERVWVRKKVKERVSRETQN